MPYDTAPQADPTTAQFRREALDAEQRRDSATDRQTRVYWNCVLQNRLNEIAEREHDRNQPSPFEIGFFAYSKSGGEPNPYPRETGEHAGWAVAQYEDTDAEQRDQLYIDLS